MKRCHQSHPVKAWDCHRHTVADTWTELKKTCLPPSGRIWNENINFSELTDTFFLSLITLLLPHSYAYASTCISRSTCRSSQEARKHLGKTPQYHIGVGRGELRSKLPGHHCLCKSITQLTTNLLHNAILFQFPKEVEEGREENASSWWALLRLKTCWRLPAEKCKEGIAKEFMTVHVSKLVFPLLYIFVY